MRLVIANDHSDVRLWCFKTNNNYPFQAPIFADLCACYLSAREARERERERTGQMPTGGYKGRDRRRWREDIVLVLRRL